MKRKSRLFTDKELEIMEQKAQGDKVYLIDPNGRFYATIKPKIQEMIWWYENKLKMLHKIIEPVKKK